MRRVPEELLEACHRRCDEEGASLEEFLGEVREDWSAADLRALVDDMEARILENIELMRAARPGLDDVAEARASEVRGRMSALRDDVGG